MSHDVAIVDFHMGNLFSVRQACEAAGMAATITSDRREILTARAVILPGVGAFGDAMSTLRTLDLISVLHDVADSGKPLIGICLGLQLLMTESEEFGDHRGLDLIPGRVARLSEGSAEAKIKVPQVGWNTISAEQPWDSTLLRNVPDKTYMYFVHSYYVIPEDTNVITSVTTYGDNTFCSSISRRNVFACQFHPERSGPVGLRVYDAIRAAIGIVPERKDVDVRV